MTKKRIGAIKVDWFNLRVEFSPNIEVISKKSQSITGGDDIEETILKFEIASDNMDKPHYKTYILEKDNIEDDEPLDLDNPWYKDTSGMSSAKISSSKTSAPTIASASSPQTIKPSISDKKAPDPAKAQKVKQLEQQIASINKMIQNIDNSFQGGTLTQEEYLKKKNFLGEKLGTLMGQLEQLKN
ncbi:MAG: hypothetical protein ACTSQJ_02295 [Promethearchaeota archaeon]